MDLGFVNRIILSASVGLRTKYPESQPQSGQGGAGERRQCWSSAHAEFMSTFLRLDRTAIEAMVQGCWGIQFLPDSTGVRRHNY